MNRTEYIGKLNALYVGDKNCLEELITTYDEKDKEIERLNNIIKEVSKELKEFNEVEIIEEDKKIEKLESYISCGWSGTCKDLKRDDLFNDLKKIGNKINEIIDKLNEMEKE